MAKSEKFDFSQPLILHQDSVKPQWVDEYDHMNLAYYVLVCDEATYEFWNLVNNYKSLEERNAMEYAVVETHVNYIREVRLGDPLTVSTQLLGHDEKRFHIFHTLSHAEDAFVAATNEVMALGFNLDRRGIQPFAESVQANIRQLFAGHGRLARPSNAGRSIGIRS
ncbi:MAG: thioesterase family protein [Acidiferrobacterales bacterium]|nr:thioesterase family protein [Acidiferrobacterales bacterium]